MILVPGMNVIADCLHSSGSLIRSADHFPTLQLINPILIIND